MVLISMIIYCVRIRQKAGWSKKIHDSNICAKYVAEAVAQGMRKDHAELAIAELQDYWGVNSNAVSLCLVLF